MQAIKRIAMGGALFVGALEIALAAPCGNDVGITCAAPGADVFSPWGLALVGAMVAVRFFKK